MIKFNDVIYKGTELLRHIYIYTVPKTPKFTKPGVPKLRKPKSFPSLNDKKKLRVNAAQEEQNNCVKIVHALAINQSLLVYTRIYCSPCQ